MARQKKKTISLTRESLAEILTETYMEATAQRARAVTQYNKWVKDVEDKIDINSLGKAVNDVLKITEQSTTLKLNIAKIMQAVILKDEKEVDGGGNVDGNVLSDSDRKNLELWMEKLDKGK